MNTDALTKLQQARIGLLLDSGKRGAAVAFFAQLLMRLALVEDPSCKTMWTDGTVIGYNPQYVLERTHDEVQGVLCHEVMHCANGHPWRRDMREIEKWNKACDYSINPILKEAGLTLPNDGLDNPAYHGKCAEEIYTLLPDEPNGGGNGNANGDEPGAGDFGPGAVRDPKPSSTPSPNVTTQTETDWQIATQQALQAAKRRGTLPGELDRWIKETLRPKVDWQSILRRFLQQVAKNDFSFRMPNKRYISMGLYLPSLYSEALGPVAFGIDVSGSVGQDQLQAFNDETNGALDEGKPERATVYYCDAKIQKVETYERGESLTLKSCGGGGTDFRPVFDAIDKSGDNPACLIYLTDGEGRYPDHAPSYPVLWVLTQEYAVPFGESVRLDLHP